MSVEAKYVYTTPEESVRLKDWAAGSSTPVTIMDFCIGMRDGAYVGEYRPVTYAPAWWKIIDEPIVNALDHLVRCSQGDSPVKNIKIGFVAGRVSIYNDGPGIEVAVHTVASQKMGRDIYVPTFVFGLLFQGENRNKGDNSITGGTNGLGAKLSNCFSDEFMVQTVDAIRHLHFEQKWSKHMETCHEPVITKSRAAPFTQLTFMPDYKHFGYESAADVANLEATVRFRALMAAAYAKYCCPKTAVWFNDQRIALSSTRAITAVAEILFPGAPLISATLRPSAVIHGMSYPWEVCVAFLPNIDSDFNQLSNVNGIVLRNNKHTKYLLNEIVECVKPKIAKLVGDKNLKFSATYVTNHIFILVNAKIPNLAWSGQRKDVMDIDPRKFAKYKFDAKFIASVVDRLKDRIMAAVFKEAIRTIERKKVSALDLDKVYIRANKAGGKMSAKCVLLTVEGMSAMSQIKSGITNTFGTDYYGIVSLGGVIINARKQCKFVETDAQTFRQQTKKLTDNEFMNILREITGLDMSCDYDPRGPTYKRDMAKLKYGSMILCVDQDLDGKGNILGLVLNVFELFWPRLLEQGYIKWFCTPIIRAYPKRGGQVHSFYSDGEYRHWLGTNDSANYNITYYKGLGTHGRAEVIAMFREMHDHVYSYYTDQQCNEFFNIYFGKDPELRKRELAQPTLMPTPALIGAQDAQKKIRCTDHLRYETNLYQKDNLERKLWSVIDGQNQSSRKILDGCIDLFKSASTVMKVSQLAGHVSKCKNYHHGEESLAKSITNKAFVATGGKQLPLLLPLSNFGNRNCGGADAASPRYINTKLNKALVDLLFPAADYWNLPFNFDEGKRSEPKYFVPIVPLAILESEHVPAHGWKIQLWARDALATIRLTTKLIKHDARKLLQCSSLPAHTYAGSIYEWRGHIRVIAGEEYSYGKYTYKNDTIYITELPLLTWTFPYITAMKKKMARNEYIADIIDRSKDDAIDIEVRLLPGAIGALMERGDHYVDGIEDYFELRKVMTHHINLMGTDNAVLEFARYEQVIEAWYPVRQHYYALRIERQRVMTVTNIRYLDNIIRYIEMCETLKLPKKQLSAIIATLDEHKFDKVHKSMLHPEFTPTADIERLMFEGERASYDYLLDLTDRNKSQESLEAYRQKRRTFECELQQLEEDKHRGRFPGATIWLRELQALEHVIREGHRTQWKFGEADKYKL